ncbi:Hypothetical protein GbCGDNIH7_5002 [Granulibacter bethesdensis]|nr:Hypothetical protein GbCGDNIH7_5002 [Granulibacter bethesdensis]
MRPALAAGLSLWPCGTGLGAVARQTRPYRFMQSLCQPLSWFFPCQYLCAAFMRLNVASCLLSRFICSGFAAIDLQMKESSRFTFYPDRRRARYKNILEIKIIFIK